MNRNDIDPDLLPESVLDLIDVIGINAALTIVEQRGGIRLYVPAKATESHWLADLIGLDALQKLVDVYAREEIEIPRCAATLKDIKDREIASSTASNSELARQYGMTERNVRKIRRRVEARNNNDQIGLFD